MQRQTKNSKVIFIVWRSLIQENKAILNLYAPNNTASKYIKQNLTELKGTRDIHNGGSKLLKLPSLSIWANKKSVTTEQVWTPQLTNFTQLTFTGHYRTQPQNTHSLEVQVGHSQKNDETLGCEGLNTFQRSEITQYASPTCRYARINNKMIY